MDWLLFADAARSFRGDMVGQNDVGNLFGKFLDLSLLSALQRALTYL